MRRGRTFRSGKTRPADGQSSNSETLSRIQSLADYIIDTLESSFQKRQRFADLRSVTRSLTLPAPISATAILAAIADDLVRGVLAKHPDEKTISLLAISVSNLEKQSVVQLESRCQKGARRAGWPTALST